MLTFISLLWGHLESIFAILFAAQGLAVAVVKLTPTPKDDAFVAKVLTVLETFASVLSVKRPTAKT